MSKYEELAFAILAQSKLSAEGLLKSQVDEEISVMLGLTAMGQFKSVSMARCGAVSDDELFQLYESLLRQTYDQHLLSNLIGSKTVEDHCAVTKLYLSGPGAADELERDLLAMDAFLRVGADRSPDLDVEPDKDGDQPRSEWVQV